MFIDEKANDRRREAFLGLAVGESGIPAEWRMAPAGQDQIEPVLTRLVTWSGALS